MLKLLEVQLSNQSLVNYERVRDKGNLLDRFLKVQ